jgi:hypothetical protein
VKRIRWAVVIAAVLALLVGLTGTVAAAGKVSLRVLNIQSPKTSIDVYLDGNLVLSDVARGTMTDAVEFPSGQHTFLVTVAGDPSSQLSIDGGILTAGGWTLVSYGAGGLGMTLAPDNDEPVAGSALLRVFAMNIANLQKPVLKENGVTLDPALAFHNFSAYVQLDPGGHTLHIYDNQTQKVAFTFTVDLESDTNYTAFIYYVAGSPHVMLVVDATSTSNTAMASQKSSGSLPAALILVGILAAAIFSTALISGRSSR